MSAVVDAEELNRVFDDGGAGGRVVFAGEQQVGMELERLRDSEDRVEQVVLLLSCSQSMQCFLHVR